MHKIIEQLKVGNIPWRTNIPRLLMHTDPDQALTLHLEGAEVPMGWKWHRAEKVIANTQARFDFGGNKALYIRPNSWPNPTHGDYIQIPSKHRFIDHSEYFLAVFHELAHWSEVRLGYKAETEVLELTAEITSCLLCTLCETPCYSTLNHDSHLPKWLALFEKDATILTKSYSAAQKTARFILSFTIKD